MRDSTTPAVQANPSDGFLAPLDREGGFESVGRVMDRIFRAMAEGVNVADIEARQKDYQEYLQTPTWHDIRARILKRAAGRCEKCHIANVTLEVHHLVYRERGTEKDSDLVALCSACHAEVHRESA